MPRNRGKKLILMPFLTVVFFMKRHPIESYAIQDLMTLPLLAIVCCLSKQCTAAPCTVSSFMLINLTSFLSNNNIFFPLYRRFLLQNPGKKSIFFSGFLFSNMFDDKNLFFLYCHF